ncbi:MAG: hypothetical protein AAF432_02195 [Planctomycetota bacterium]
MNTLAERGSTQERTVEDLVFIGVGKDVQARDRYTGELAWEWRMPKGRSPIIVLDGDRLIVITGQHGYCVDPLYGQQVWHQRISRWGGIPSVATSRGNSNSSVQAQIAAMQAAAAAAAAG